MIAVVLLLIVRSSIDIPLVLLDTLGYRINISYYSTLCKEIGDRLINSP